MLNLSFTTAERRTCLIKGMSAVQPILYPAGGIILIQPNIKNVGNSALGYPYLKASHPHASASCKFLQDKLHRRLIYNTSKNKRNASVLVFGKKGDSMSDNEVAFIFHRASECNKYLVFFKYTDVLVPI